MASATCRGNIIAGSVRFRRPLSTMFLGYVVMGIGFSWLALSVWLLPPGVLLPAMMIGGLLGGSAARSTSCR